MDNVVEKSAHIVVPLIDREIAVGIILTVFVCLSFQSSYLRSEFLKSEITTTTQKLECV